MSLASQALLSAVMRRPLSLVLMSASLLLASCVGAPERPAPSPAPAPRPEPAPQTLPPPAPVAWQDRETTPGNWRYQSDGAGTVALFGATAQDSSFLIRCDRASRRVALLRNGGVATAMTVRTSYGAVSWPAAAGPGGVAATQAQRAANDPVLDQIAYSRGRFAVEVQGLPTLILPAWGEVGRVIEDCRS